MKMTERHGQSGFTLIEILIATIILAGGMMSLMAGLGNCARMMNLAKQFQDAQFIFSLGERQYPIPQPSDITEPEDDERLNIEETTADDLFDGLELEVDSATRKLYRDYKFSREIVEKELDDDAFDDGLYLLRTTVRWGDLPDQREELIRLIRKK